MNDRPLCASERFVVALSARLDAIEAHPVIRRVLDEQATIARLTDAEPAWMAEGRELIERAG